MTDYNKWDKLDLDDDEDVSDCHPNIDGVSHLPHCHVMCSLPEGKCRSMMALR
jgi:hypothetical protein